MPKSPFKFLDSYTKEDRDIFFGRDREIEEMYQKMFESKILLVYGISGTGKTSIINCGLANEFEDSDWLPVKVRRGRNITESLVAELQKKAISPWRGDKSAVRSPQSAEKELTPKRIVKALQSLYLDHFKPIYIIVDQFEELFIFGSKEEREEFIQTVKQVVDSDVQCRFIFSIREEYLAGVTEFEHTIPDFLSNRMRIEKMSWTNAKQVIEEPCRVHGIKVEEGLAETILGKLSPESTEIELTYLQVLLDKFFRLATKSDTMRSVVIDIPQSGIIDDSPSGGSSDSKQPAPPTIMFTKPLLESIGDVSDLLGSFLEEQVSQLDDPDAGLVVLKSFVSIKGTKKQITLEEISEFARTLGQEISDDDLKNMITNFVNLRILRDKDEADRYELRHDSLATKIYEKITLVEKDLLEVRQFIDNAYSNYEKRNVYLSVDDLKYIAPYEDKLFLNQRIENFIENSKKEGQKVKRRRRNIVIGASISLLIILSGFSVWAVVERGNALKQQKIAEEQKNAAIAANIEAEQAREQALEERNRAIENEELANAAKQEAEKAKNEEINAKEIVTQELYASIINSLSVSPVAVNVMYVGLDNPIRVTASGISDENLIVEMDNGIVTPGIVKYGSTTYDGNYVVKPRIGRDTCKIFVKGVTNKGDTLNFGYRSFRVKKPPPPYASLQYASGGKITKEDLLQSKVLAETGFVFDIRYTVNEFTLGLISGGQLIRLSSRSENFSSDQLDLIKEKLETGQRIQIINIIAIGPTGGKIELPALVYDIKLPESFAELNRALMWSLTEYQKNQDYNGFIEYLKANPNYNNISTGNQYRQLINYLLDNYDNPYFLIPAEGWARSCISKDSYNSHENYYLLSKILFKIGKPEEAIESREKAIYYLNLQIENTNVRTLKNKYQEMINDLMNFK